MNSNPNYKYCPKSEKTYLRYYNEFMTAKEELGISSVDDGLKAVFDKWATCYQASTLSTRLSGIKSILISREIGYKDSTFERIQKCISNYGRSSDPQKQAAAFTLDDVVRFLEMSHDGDADMLLKKVILLTGVFCLLRGQELRRLMRRDVRIGSDGIHIHYYRPKVDTTGKGFNGWVPLELKGVDVKQIYVDYLGLLKGRNASMDAYLFHRPLKTAYGYTGAVIGKNQFDELSKEIAQTLEKDDYQRYTTHTYRRSGATILASLGANNEEIRLMGDWKSPQVAARYVADSDVPRQNILRKALDLSPVKPRNRLALPQGLGPIFSSGVVINGGVHFHFHSSESSTMQIGNSQTNTLQLPESQNMGFLQNQPFDEIVSV